jgi:hypothetical protein
MPTRMSLVLGHRQFVVGVAWRAEIAGQHLGARTSFVTIWTLGPGTAEIMVSLASPAQLAAARCQCMSWQTLAGVS